MEEWKKYKLGDILADKGYIRGPFGSALKRGDMKSEGIPVYEQQHAIYQMRDFRFFIDEKKFQEMKRFQVNENDLVISCSGTVGKVTIISKDDPKGIISQALLILRVNPNIILPKYLQYFFISSNGYNSIISRSSGSVQVNIAKRDVIEAIPLSLPPLPTQQKIAAILSSLDDKIELNNKINTNLEQQAQALFKNWFVDFEPFGGKMPEGWKVGKLSEIAEITMGQSPDGKSYNEDGIGTVFYQGRAEFGTRFPTRRLFTTEPKRIAKKFDTLMSVRAPVGDLNIANEDCCIGRGLAAIHSKDNHQSFVHYTVVSLRPQLDVFNGEGTVFGCINRDALNNMEVIIPSKNDLNKFEQIVSTFDTEIFNRSEENDRLKNIRDTLLPKLMNGDIIKD
jgi:type I restriction enzyme S subunit